MRRRGWSESLSVWGTIMTNPLKSLLFVGVGVALSAGVALGQSTFASVLGTVRDPSGGVLSGCVVTVENAGTSARRIVISDLNGSYSVPNLEPGAYAVKMEAAGFQVATYNLELLARQTARI